jgi:flavin-dependent thymidylate synthase
VIPGWLRERRRGYQQLTEAELYHTSRQSFEDGVADPLTRDLAFNRHSMNDGHHISPYDNGEIQIGTDGIEVRLVQGIDEAALRRTLSMATRATIGLNLNAPLPGDWEYCTELGTNNPPDPGDDRGEYIAGILERKCSKGHSAHKWSIPSGREWMGQIPGDDWEEMLKGGLQTALESQVIVFAVSGVSRTGTHQIVRSRRAAFHQQSQRASYMGDRPEMRMPESVWRNPRARRAFLEAVKAAHIAYRAACEEDISYQDARFILPEGTTNYIMMEYSLREFMAVYAYRGCSMFQWEIVAIMRQARRLLVEAYPWLEPYIKISCEKTSGSKDLGRATIAGQEDYPPAAHTCTFQGWERVERQCDFPWARDTNRTFRSEAHEIGGRKQLGVQPHREEGL